MLEYVHDRYQFLYYSKELMFSSIFQTWIFLASILSPSPSPLTLSSFSCSYCTCSVSWSSHSAIRAYSLTTHQLLAAISVAPLAAGVIVNSQLCCVCLSSDVSQPDNILYRFSQIWKYTHGYGGLL